MDRRYIVVLGACLTQFTVIGLLFCYGQLLPIFEAEFGWSRAALSMVQSAGFLAMGLLAMPAGRLSDRFGPRIVLGTTGVLYGLGWVLMSQVSEFWQLFAIFGIFVSLGLCTHDVVTLGTIARWFENRRGIMTGVVKVGTGLGQMVTPLIFAYLLVTVGWRGSVVTMGIVAGTLLLLGAFAMKPAPQKTGSAGTDIGLSFPEAKRTRVLWTQCAIQLLFFPVLTTIPLHLVAHGSDLGMSATIAATLLTVMGGSSIAGRLLIGRFADKIGGRRAYQLCFVPLIGALVALIYIEAHWMLFGIIAVYGFAHGGFFTVVSPTVAEFFGTKAHGAIFGIILFCGTIGGAIGPIAAGRVFDMTGSYDLAFGGLAVAAAIGLGLVLTLPGKGAGHLAPAV